VHRVQGALRASWGQVSSDQWRHYHCKLMIRVDVIKFSMLSGGATFVKSIKFMLNTIEIQKGKW
jgi:hypothetical protein